MGATKHDQFLKISNAKIKFDAFVRIHKCLGFNRISPGKEARNQTGVLKVSPPNSPRIKGFWAKRYSRGGWSLLYSDYNFQCEVRAFPSQEILGQNNDTCSPEKKKLFSLGKHRVRVTSWKNA
ncbi:MAG: hypothetical protein R3B55_03675 [Candidatus Paceibacterota bacterium]